MEEKILTQQNPQQPQAQTPAASPSIAPSKKTFIPNFINNNRKKIVIWGTAVGIVLLFLVLLILFSGGKLLGLRSVAPTPTPAPVQRPTPTPDPTAQWRVYGNEKYGFQVSYPHEFTFETTQKENGLFDFSEFIDFKNYTRTTRQSNPDATNITILALYTGNITSAADWIKNEGEAKAPGLIGPNITNLTNTAIAGEDAVTYEDGINIKRKSVAFYKEGRLILFTLVPTTEDKGSFSDVRESVEYFDNVLSTFRFTDLTFIPISTTLSFTLPDGWKINQESRDRIQISNGLKSMVFYKASGKTYQQLEEEVKTRLTKNFKNSTTSVDGRAANDYSGCNDTEDCELTYITTVVVGNYSYQLIYQGEDDPIYSEIIKSIKINQNAR